MRRSASLNAADHPIRVDFRNHGADSAIIFVHGFAGQAEKTWGRFPQFLLEHPDLGAWDVFGVGYSSSLRLDMTRLWAADAGLTALGVYLRTMLTLAPLERYKQIALIAHSMGGLIAQQALLDKEMCSRISHLFLFGTPSGGIGKANPFRGLHQQARDMAVGSAFITQLRAAWANAYGQRRPFVMRAIAGERDTFVPIDSALGPFADDVRFVVPGDHVTMVTPQDAASLSVQIVVRGLLGTATPNNLPRQLTSFIGREDDLAAIKTLLIESRMVTLVGAGGIGKTRLSLQVAADSLDASGDGVWFTELAPVRDPARVPSAVATVLDVTESAERPITESLVSFLRRKKLLLILDNCEQVVDAAAALSSTILRECPEVRILATSRQPLGVTGEHPHRLSSLAVPPENATLSKEDALQYGAVALFADRARIATESFKLSSANAPIVAQICRRLDGIALAIELAAPRLKMLSLEQLAQRLSERFRVLTGGSRDVLPRQQTMRALIDWSYDLLDEPERALFRRVGIFVDGFTLEGATAIATDEVVDALEVFDVLASLVDKSLVVAEPAGDTTRYRLLESMRAYAGEKLEAAGEQAQFAERHFAYLHDLFQRARESHQTSPREATILALTAELQDLRAALDWALTNDPRRGAELLTSTRLFNFLAFDHEAIERAQRFEAVLENGDANLLARVWRYISACAERRYDSKYSFAAAERAVSYSRAAENAETLGDALIMFGRAAGLVRRPADSRAAFHEAEIACELSSAQKLDLLTARVFVETVTGDLSTADVSAEDLEQLRTQERSLGNQRGELDATSNLAEVEHRRGETKRAVVLAREVLTSPASAKNARRRAHTEVNLAGYLLTLDDSAGARAATSNVLLFFSKNDPADGHVLITLEHVALLSAIEGDFARAARLEGYTDNGMRALGFEREYNEITTHDRLIAILRKRFSTAELASLLAAGAAMTPDAAIAEGLA